MWVLISTKEILINGIINQRYVIYGRLISWSLRRIISFFYPFWSQFIFSNLGILTSFLKGENNLIWYSNHKLGLLFHFKIFFLKILTNCVNKSSCYISSHISYHIKNQIIISKSLPGINCRFRTHWRFRALLVHAVSIYIYIYKHHFHM